MTNTILTAVRESFTDRKEFEDSNGCTGDQPWDMIDQAWAWRESIKEPSALTEWTAEEIAFAVKVLSRFINAYEFLPAGA